MKRKGTSRASAIDAIFSRFGIEVPLRCLPCRCGAGCNYYDHRRKTGGCGGQVVVVDADSPCPLHICTEHQRKYAR